jgi:hypothetical protein
MLRLSSSYFVIAVSPKHWCRQVLARGCGPEQRESNETVLRPTIFSLCFFSRCFSRHFFIFFSLPTLNTPRLKVDGLIDGGAFFISELVQNPMVRLTGKNPLRLCDPFSCETNFVELSNLNKKFIVFCETFCQGKSYLRMSEEKKRNPVLHMKCSGETCV